MRFARTNLGLIPDWQFSMDPAINPKINPNVHFPKGVYQTTPQPLGPYYQGSELGGIVHPEVMNRMSQVKSLGLCPPGFVATSHGCLPRSTSGISGVFDSAWWTNRKWLALGGVAVVGLGALAMFTKVLR